MLVAASGGPDSTVLAHLCLQAGLPVALAHAAYGLRGAESDADEAAVRDWGESHGVTVHVQHFSKEEALVAGSGNLQGGARSLRYGWMDAVRKSNRYGAVATAHHADDVAETVLMNLMRGTGLRGLHGIAERRGHLIRPLLWARKDVLLAYAAAHQIAYRTDRSNEEDTYLRNRIRLHVIPAMEAILPGAAARMAETGARVREAEVLYQEGLKARSKGLIEQRGSDWYLPVRKWARAEPQATLLHEVLRDFNFEASQIPSVAALFSAETGREVRSGTHRILRHRDFLVVTPLRTTETALLLFDALPGAPVETEGGTFAFLKEQVPAALAVPAAVALLDAKEFLPPYTLRRMRPGDYFYPLGMARKKKKIARFLTGEKVPRHEKESAWVLLSGDRIAWVAGRRIDERFKVQPSTKEVVRVSLTLPSLKTGAR